MWEVEREKERTSLLLCIFRCPPTGLFTWDIVAESSATHKSGLLFLSGFFFFLDVPKALVEHWEVRHISCLILWGEKGLEPLYCFLFLCTASLLWWIAGLEQGSESCQCGLLLDQSRMLFSNFTCSEESCYTVYYVTYQLCNDFIEKYFSLYFTMWKLCMTFHKNIIYVLRFKQVSGKSMKRGDWMHNLSMSQHFASVISLWEYDVIWFDLI